MLYLRQSNQLATLATHLVAHYAQNQDPFTPFHVIVPHQSMGAYVQELLCAHTGISMCVQSNLFGSYQWRLIDSVLSRHHAKSDTDTLTPLGMQFAIYGEFLGEFDEDHPLYPIIEGKNNSALWRISGEMARAFSGYLTHRRAWLEKMDNGTFNINTLIDKKQHMDSQAGSAPLQEWQIQDIQTIAGAQIYLWNKLFKDIHIEQNSAETRFWQILKQGQGLDLLSDVHIFTLEDAPTHVLKFLHKLSQFVDVYIYHFNPSAEFWADIVDDEWLQRQKVIAPHQVLMRESGQALLSVLGKSSRDVFANLALFLDSHADWQDEFCPPKGNTLLATLQKDMLEFGQQSFDNNAVDDSLALHACPNLRRQLEVLQMRLLVWLNADPTRRPKDVLVLVPDIDNARATIDAVFGDGLISYRIGGALNPMVANLSGAVLGFLRLKHRIDAPSFSEWFLLDEVHGAFGLSFDDAKLAITLLQTAGFCTHLNAHDMASTLHPKDTDYRYSFAYALDRLVLGASAQAGDMLGVYSLADPSEYRIVQALCACYQAIQAIDLSDKSVPAWIDMLTCIIDTWFCQSDDNARAVLFSAMRGLKKNAPDTLCVDVHFFVQMLETQINSQKIAAEPSKVLAFARFGDFRKMPFKLIVMLEMNFGAFPRDEPKSAFDLIAKLGRRRGDRSLTEDDQGAFLDALVSCQALWLFYQHQNDAQKSLLPAQIIVKLQQFLAQKGVSLSAQAHPATAYDAQALAMDVPAKPLWHNIYYALQKPTIKATPSATSTFDITLDNLANILSKPLHTYARMHKLQLVKDSAFAHLPPLNIDSLQNYALRQAHHNEQSHTLPHDNLLPVGVQKMLTLDASLQNHQAQIDALHQKAAAHGIDWQGQEYSDGVYFMLYPNTQVSKKLHAYIGHLVRQLQSPSHSIASFADGVCEFVPMSATDARTQLAQYQTIAEQIITTPMLFDNVAKYDEPLLHLVENYSGIDKAQMLENGKPFMDLMDMKKLEIEK